MALFRCSNGCRATLKAELGFAVCCIAHPKICVGRDIVSVVASRNQRRQKARRTNLIAIINGARRGCRKSNVTSQTRKTRETILTGASKNFAVIRGDIAKGTEHCKVILEAVFAFSLGDDNAFCKRVTSAAIALWQILN